MSLDAARACPTVLTKVTPLLSTASVRNPASVVSFVYSIKNRSISTKLDEIEAQIAAAMRFILSAPAMTGQMIALDGGQHLGWAQSQQTPMTE